MAGEFENGLATSIYYSKWVFLIAGMVLILRAAIKSSRGESTSKTTNMTIIIALLPSLILWLIDAFWQSNQGVASYWGGGGRPMVEYFLAQSGLLSANALAQWRPFGLLVVAIFMSSAAAVAIKASAAESDDQMVQMWKGWLAPAVLIFLVLNPSITTSSPGTSGAVMQKVMGAKKPIPQTNLANAGGANGSPSLAFTQANFKILAGAKNGAPQAPLVLSLMNDAMDDFVGSIVGLFSSTTFQKFGMTGAKSVTSRLAQKVADPDLAMRVSFFTQNCLIPAIADASRADEQVAQAWSGVSDDASILYPFSPIYSNTYNKSPACKAMLKGGYYFNQKGEIGRGGKRQSQIYKHSLEDDLLGDIAFQDPNLRRKYGWKTSAQAADSAPILKRRTYSKPDAFFSGKIPLHVALVSQVFGDIAKNIDFADPSIQAKRFENDNGVLNFLKTMAEGGYLAVGSAKGAVESELVNLKLPIWMGIAQAVLLACFPLVFCISLMPSKASMIGYYFLTLFWLKSYVIAWALISNFDTWISNLRGLTPHQMMAVAQVMQAAQLYSPFLMAIVIFGAAAAAQSLSKGGGAA